MTKITVKNPTTVKLAIKLPERKDNLLIPFVKENNIASAITMPARITDQLLPLAR